MSEPIVCLAMPRRDELVHYGAMTATREAVSKPTRVLELNPGTSTILEHAFNLHWAQALDCRDNRGATHFAMIHSDVCPENGWLTTLLDELTALDADVVSAVVPIRDERGLTSTAVYSGDPWRRRRLTLTEVFNLPETFSGDDLGKRLMVNTGLWVCDLRREWCDEVLWDSEKRIINRNGNRIAEVISEDWLFSHWLNERGGSLYATRKVQLEHDRFPNREPWGHWTTDEDYMRALDMEAACV